MQYSPCTILILLLTIHHSLAALSIPKVDADPIPVEPKPNVGEDPVDPSEPNDPDNAPVHIGADDPSDLDPPSLPKPDTSPSKPHAPILLAQLTTPKNPSQEEKSDSELGEDLSNVADLISTIIGLATSTATTTVTAAIHISPSLHATTTPPPNAPGCLNANSIYQSCASATTSVKFSSLVWSDQASCLCYATRSNTWYWQPSVFDAYVGSCANYASTASLETGKSVGAGDVRAGIGGAKGLCDGVGDVRTTAVVVGGSAEGKVTMTTTESVERSTTGFVTTAATAAATGANEVTGGASKEHGEGSSLFTLLICVGVGVFGAFD